MTYDLASARARGIGLPADDSVAQDVMDDVWGWLEARIGLLFGSRTETFYVGIGQTDGRLALKRRTDTASLTDGGVAVSSGHFRVVNDAEIERRYEAPSQVWTGPYVAATYTPTDESLVNTALWDLLAVAAVPASPFQSEQMGAYSYQKGSVNAALASKAAIVASILPTRSQFVVISSNRRLGHGDPVINRAEPAT